MISRILRSENQNLELDRRVSTSLRMRMLGVELCVEFKSRICDY